MATNTDEIAKKIFEIKLADMRQKTKLVVLDGHTLGYIDPRAKGIVNVLHSSVLRGAPFSMFNGVKLTSDNMRLASEKDFDEFRVSFKGFDNPEIYEYV